MCTLGRISRLCPSALTRSVSGSTACTGGEHPLLIQASRKCWGGVGGKERLARPMAVCADRRTCEALRGLAQCQSCRESGSGPNRLGPGLRCHSAPAHQEELRGQPASLLWGVTVQAGRSELTGETEAALKTSSLHTGAFLFSQVDICESLVVEEHQKQIK